MKIPKKIKIGGIVYKIVFEELDDQCGRYDRHKNLILIDTNLAKGQQELTLWHEILHAINGEMDGNTIDFLAQSIHQVITDNKLYI